MPHDGPLPHTSHLDAIKFSCRVPGIAQLDQFVEAGLRPLRSYEEILAETAMECYQARSLYPRRDRGPVIATRVGSRCWPVLGRERTPRMASRADT